MKALVLDVAGRKAVLLLPGGEMRTVRAQKGWQTGMEVSVKPYPRPRMKKRRSTGAALYPLAACAAAFLIVFAGFRLLNGGHIDRQHLVQPLSSGQPAMTAVPTQTPAPTDAPTASSEPAVAPTPVPTSAPTAEPAASLTPSAPPTPSVPPATLQPTPPKKTDHDGSHSGEICDECGQRGHDDDDCPNQVCDECGRRGHDDDDCPNQVCDECGRRGHDDDDCPNGRDDD